MILHFSHIGLTDGLTFMIPFGGWVPATRLWLPLRPPLPGRGGAPAQIDNRASSRTPDGSKSYALAAPSGARSEACSVSAECHGVRTLGPSRVIATVNSK